MFSISQLIDGSSRHLYVAAWIDSACKKAFLMFLYGLVITQVLGFY